MRLKLNGYNAQLTIRRISGIMIVLVLGFIFLMLGSIAFESLIKTICCLLYGLTRVLDKFFNLFISLF